MSKEDQTNCIFCKILSGEYPISEVYRDELCVGLMTIEPVNTGHAMVIPREHFPYLADVPAETAGHMLKVAQKIAAAIRASELPCDGINLFVADGEVAHQSVFHSHFHIYPRLKDDGFGFRYDERHFQSPPREELDKTAEMIRSQMSTN